VTDCQSLASDKQPSGPFRQRTLQHPVPLTDLRDRVVSITRFHRETRILAITKIN
jgi:hypothetical protein